MSSQFKVEQIDHIHVYVSNQREAARWYREVFGLEIVAEVEHWAADGPLTISSDGGNTSLALFDRKVAITERRSTIAFRVAGAGFLEFLNRLENLDLRDREGNRLTASDVYDHDLSFSVYFNDPDGNPFELTTYDYEEVAARLENVKR